MFAICPQNVDPFLLLPSMGPSSVLATRRFKNMNFKQYCEPKNMWTLKNMCTYRSFIRSSFSPFVVGIVKHWT